jgi:hypothetical protein
LYKSPAGDLYPTEAAIFNKFLFERKQSFTISTHTYASKSPIIKNRKRE